MKIGIPACFMYPERARNLFWPKVLSYAVNDIFTFVARPGVQAILLPDLPFSLLETYLEEMDGFVFQGGSDLAPQTYDAKPLDEGRWKGDPIRDEFELSILEYAFQARKPILGLCRGCQLINVFFGGDLFQDISTEVSEATLHRDADRYDSHTHRIFLQPGGLLQSLYAGRKEGVVNSIHHQAIKTLGKGLHVEAVSSEDGLIEAISYQGSEHPFCLGVQWHPEFPAPADPDALENGKLIDRFLNSCQTEKETDARHPMHTSHSE